MNSATATEELSSSPPPWRDAEMPEGVRKILERADLLYSEERVSTISSFQPDPTDIFLSAGIKTGSTWLQHIMHELRSGGDMDFDDINNVVVVPDILPDTADMGKPQRFQPRMFKTHFAYDFCPKGAGKYIVLMRNPKAVAVSAYWYYADWVFDKDTISLSEYVEYFMAGKLPDEYFRLFSGPTKHQASWYPHRKDPNVLWLHYEDMKSDLRQCIKLISDFLNIGVGDQKLLDLVEEQSSFEFMKKHESKFDDHTFNDFVARLLIETGDEVLRRKTPKVRKGDVNAWTGELPKELAEALDSRWECTFKPLSGYSTYEEMRAGVNAELGRNFAS